MDHHVVQQRFHPRTYVRQVFHSFQRGLPHLLPGQHWYVVSSLINALGSGLYYPFAVLYGHQVVGLSFPLVGLGLTVAKGVSLATVPLQGALVDRVGARTLQIAAHLVRAVGFLGLLLAHSFPVFLLLAALVALGDSTPAGDALVAEFAAPEERDRWFGLRRVLFNAGVGAGAALGGVAVATGGTGGYQVIVVLNAVSFVAAALMLTRLPVQTTRATSPTGAPAPATPSTPSASLEASAGASRAARPGASGYRAILRDHPFLVLLLVSVVLWMSNYSVDLILAPYSVSVLRTPLWVPGALFTFNTALVVGAQVPVMGLLASRRRTRALLVGGIGYMVVFLGLAATPLLPAYMLVVVGTLFALMLLATMAEIIVVPTMTTLAAAMAPQHLRGRYLALANLSFSTAIAITPLVATVLLATIPAAFWLTLTVALLVAVAAVAWLDRRLPLATVRAPAGSPQRSPHASPAGDDEPGVDEPGVDEPGMDEPGVDEPGVDEPGVAASEALTAQNRATAPGHP
jgi:MFS family permease